MIRMKERLFTREETKTQSKTSPRDQSQHEELRLFKAVVFTKHLHSKITIYGIQQLGNTRYTSTRQYCVYIL